jgi:hypothetical protein
MNPSGQRGQYDSAEEDFHTPKTNVVESSLGYSVEVLGRLGMIYRQGGRSVAIDSELLTTESIEIFASSIKTWESAEGSKPVSPEERERIVARIRRAMEFDNCRVVVREEWHPG